MGIYGLIISVVLGLLSTALSHDEALYSYRGSVLLLNDRATYRGVCLREDGTEKSIKDNTVDLSVCEGVEIYGEYDHHRFRLRFIKRWEVFSFSSPGLDVLPAKDPFSLKVGKKLDYRVFLNSEPVGGAQVFVNGRPAGITRSGGSIRLKLRKGKNEIVSVVEKDGVEYIAVLIFER